MKLFYFLIIIFMTQIAFSGTETGNGGDGVLQDGKLTLLDSLEYDFELIDIQNYDFSNHLTSVLNILESKLEKDIVKPQNLVWALTDRKLEDIKDEGAIRHKFEGDLVQIAVQKDGVVVIQKELFNLLQNSNDSSKNDKLGLILHEVLIATALKYNLNLKAPNLGTGPIRELVWYSKQKVLDGLPSQLFIKIWQKLPYVLGEVTINEENNSFHIETPRAMFGGKLFPIDVVLFEIYNQESAWCYYFAKKLNLLKGLDSYKSYQGTYGSISTSPENIAVSTGVNIQFTINNNLIFSPEQSSTVFSWLTCRQTK